MGKAHDYDLALRDLPTLGHSADWEGGTGELKTVKFFTPDAGATWFITEINRETGMMFGLCDLGLGFPELGYVSLHEIRSVRGALGLRPEVDLHWEGTLSDAYEALGNLVPDYISKPRGGTHAE